MIFMPFRAHQSVHEERGRDRFVTHAHESQTRRIVSGSRCRSESLLCLFLGKSFRREQCLHLAGRLGSCRHVERAGALELQLCQECGCGDFQGSRQAAFAADWVAATSGLENPCLYTSGSAPPREVSAVGAAHRRRLTPVVSDASVEPRVFLPKTPAARGKRQRLTTTTTTTMPVPERTLLET